MLNNMKVCWLHIEQLNMGHQVMTSFSFETIGGKKSEKSFLDQSTPLWSKTVQGWIIINTQETTAFNQEKCRKFYTWRYGPSGTSSLWATCKSSPKLTALVLWSIRTCKQNKVFVQCFVSFCCTFASKHSTDLIIFNDCIMSNNKSTCMSVYKKTFLISKVKGSLINL